MSVSDDLRRCGFEPTDDPPVVSVPVGSSSVAVRVQEVDWRVVLRAEIAAPGAIDPGAATAAAAAAAGDTTLEATGTTLVATRTLVEPLPGMLRDAIFELAKAATAVAGPTSGVGAAAAATSAEPAAAMAAGPVASTVQPVATGDFWFYVDSEQQLMSGGSASQVVGVLRPGQWYQGQGEEAGWVRATDERGVQGWVGAAAVRRDQ